VVWEVSRIRARMREESSFDFCCLHQLQSQVPPLVCAFLRYAGAHRPRYWTLTLWQAKGLVKTKLYAFSSRQPEPTCRRYLPRQLCAAPAIELTKTLRELLRMKERYTPISQVTQPSLHPMSKTLAPWKRASGSTASLASFTVGRLE
jgi:hypothetical protein